MGKGDRKTLRGKICRGSYGKHRVYHKQGSAATCRKAVVVGARPSVAGRPVAKKLATKRKLA